jgi:hypothetical protein
MLDAHVHLCYFHYNDEPKNNNYEVNLDQYQIAHVRWMYKKI